MKTSSFIPGESVKSRYVRIVAENARQERARKKEQEDSEKKRSDMREAGAVLLEDDPVFRSSPAAQLTEDDLEVLRALPDAIDMLEKEQGPSGPTGYTPIKGVDYVDGKDGETVIGPRGPRGERGMPGKDGRNGIDGKNAEVIDVEPFARNILQEHEQEFDHLLIHDPHFIGTKEVDESGIADGKILAYSEKKDKLVYIRLKAPTTSEGGGYAFLGGGGSTKKNIRVITADDTIMKRDQIIHCDATAGNIALTFFSAVGNSGRNFYIKRIDDALSNTVTFTLHGSETIDFETLYMLVNQGSGAEVYTDGQNWFIQRS